MEFLNIINAEPSLSIPIAILFGLLIGSFLNVVIHRLPLMMEQEWRLGCAELLGQEPPSEQRFNLIHPPSRCPHCQRAIKPWENIPLLSFLLMRGRCAGCRHPISWQYPLVELTTGILAGVVVWHYGFTLTAAAAFALTAALVALSVIDWHHQQLPDDITQPFLWLGIICSFFGLFTDLESSVIGAIAGYLSLRLVYELFKLLTGREGMGFGDFKLLGMLGAWLGWQALPAIILAASVAGSIVGVGLIATGRLNRETPMPFGPYLAIAGWICLLWGGSWASLG